MSEDFDPSAWVIPAMPPAEIPKPLQPHPTLRPRRGGIVTTDGYELVICQRCKAVAVWPPDLRTRWWQRWFGRKPVRYVPPGHNPVTGACPGNTDV